VRVLYGSRTGSGSITNKENQKENKVRQTDEESTGTSQSRGPQTERSTEKGLRSGAHHEESAQTETPDVLIQYRDALVQLDLNWKEWFVVGIVAVVALFILDYQGYY
jgi:hypothetical protein